MSVGRQMSGNINIMLPTCIRTVYLENLSPGLVARKLIRELGVGSLTKREVLELYHMILTPKGITELQYFNSKFKLTLQRGPCQKRGTSTIGILPTSETDSPKKNSDTKRIGGKNKIERKSKKKPSKHSLPLTKKPSKMK